ncbi:MAG: HlyD family efflux transporter periplasmic adaptor subunit, partial [Pseudomonadota bacterium]
ALLEKMKSAVKVAEAQGAAPEHLSEWQQKIEELEAKQKHIASLIAEKTLVAPFAGVVGTWMAPESAYVNPGQPLVVLRDQSQWLVQYRLPEKYRTQIAVGQDLRVRTRILPEGVAAKVTEIAPDIDPQTQSFSVTAVLAESHAWVPGMHADVAQKLVDPS